MDGILNFYTYKTTSILNIKHFYGTNVDKFNKKVPYLYLQIPYFHIFDIL